MKPLIDYLIESKDPFKELIKTIQKGKMYWEEILSKTNKKLKDNEVWSDDEVWEAIRKKYSPAEITKIYKYLDYIRKDNKYRYAEVKQYIDAEQRGEVKHID